MIIESLDEFGIGAMLVRSGGFSGCTSSWASPKSSKKVIEQWRGHENARVLLFRCIIYGLDFPVCFSTPYSLPCLEVQQSWVDR